MCVCNTLTLDKILSIAPELRITYCRLLIKPYFIQCFMYKLIHKLQACVARLAKGCLHINNDASCRSLVREC